MRIAISGVNRGIGEGLAREFAKQDDVIGFGRSRPSWAGSDSSDFQFVKCDMADHARLEEVCSAISDPIDVLICSAATFADGAGTIEWFHPQALQEAFAINVIAPLVMARTLKKNLDAAERRLVVMMSTGNASLEGNTAGTLLGYRLTKTALNQAVRTLAAEWGPQGFTVVALNPGWVKTDMGGPDAELTVEVAAAQISDFVRRVAACSLVNGAFVNTDGSPLPW